MRTYRRLIAISSLFVKLLVVLFFTTLTANNSMAQQQNFDALMREYGMINIQDLDPEILVDLKYASKDNFVGKNMYGDLKRAHLEKEFADRVVRAQRILKQRNPNYTLLIYDAARPISTQRTMRKIVEGTEFEDFIADGTRGGRHNFGVAVDLTIATTDGKALDMGAGFDEFSKASYVKGTPDTSDPKTRTIEIYRGYAESQVANGTLSRSAADNRILLMEVMCEAGFHPYRLEWWHYEDIMSMESVRKQYRLLDF